MSNEPSVTVGILSFRESSNRASDFRPCVGLRINRQSYCETAGPFISAEENPS